MPKNITIFIYLLQMGFGANTVAF